MDAAGPRSGHDSASRPSCGRLVLRRLSPAMGAEVEGLDAETLAASALGPFLHGALLEHQLLLLRACIWSRRVSDASAGCSGR